VPIELTGSFCFWSLFLTANCLEYISTKESKDEDAKSFQAEYPAISDLFGTSGHIQGMRHECHHAGDPAGDGLCFL
jgi:hypothetical protein